MREKGRETNAGIKARCLNQNGRNLGRCWSQCLPKTSSEDAAQPGKFCRERGKSSQLIPEMGGQSGHHAPLCAGLSVPYDLPLGVSLVHTVWSHSLFTRLLEGKLGKRSGHL